MEPTSIVYFILKSKNAIRRAKRSYLVFVDRTGLPDPTMFSGSECLWMLPPISYAEYVL